MTRPTLIQSLLNRPSRTYAFPENYSKSDILPTTPPKSRRQSQHEYHSIKSELLKVASELNSTVSVAVTVPLGNGSMAGLDGVGDKSSDGSESSEPGLGGSGREEEDVFCTPDGSPRLQGKPDGRCLSHSQGPADMIDVTIQNQAGPSSAPSHLALPARSLSPVPSSSSTAASTADSVDTYFASSHSDASTDITTPATTSESGRSSSAGQSSSSSSASVVRRSRRSKAFSVDGSILGGSKRTPQTVAEAGEDWAKDVRWLVPPTKNHKGSSTSLFATPKRSLRDKPVTDADVREAMKREALGVLAAPPQPRTTPHRRARSLGNRNSLRSRTMPLSGIGRRMSAVWEVDEVDPDDKQVVPSSPKPFPMVNMHTLDKLSAALPRRSRSVSDSHAPSVASSQHKRSSSLRSVTSTTSSAQYTTFSAPSRIVDIPVPLPVSAGGESNGYTSLVLPRAAYTQPKRNSLLGTVSLFMNSSEVDVTRYGLAQTTMSTISIIKNGASASRRSSRIFSLSSRSSLHMSPTPDHLLYDSPSPLSFSSHTTPPNKVHSNQVLVQVLAVGIDALDAKIVRDRAMKPEGFGFIPGRSFVGRAIEVGYDVNGIDKRDWVVGLLDVRKCGALAEFIVADKRRITRCQRPTDDFTLDQLALLPLCGIQAHRAVRTAGYIEKGLRVLVLQAHEGVGPLIVQELMSSGAEVVAQVSPDDLQEEEICDDMKDSKDIPLRRRQSGTVVDRLANWGASEVKIADPLSAIDSFADDSFDFAIDTIGGREIWDKSRRILHDMGQFTTLVGESTQTIPTKNAQFKSSFRSLSRAFVKKGRKSIGYSWVSVAADIDLEGEDIRNTLTSVVELATGGVIKPHISSSNPLPFERAPELFASGKQGPAALLSGNRTAVIRLMD